MLEYHLNLDKMNNSSKSVGYPKQTSTYPSIVQPAEDTSRIVIHMLPIPMTKKRGSVANNQSLKLAIIKSVLCTVIFLAFLIMGYRF